MSICDDYGIPHSEFKEWDEDDQDKAIAWRIYKAQHCDKCGTADEEWQWDRFAYEAEVHRCRGCEILQMTEEALQEEKGSKAGLRVVLKKSEPTMPVGVQRK